MSDGRAAIIDLDALRHNVEVLRERVAPAELMVVVKADAYGHGSRIVAETVTAAGIRWLGALDLETALAVREHVSADVRILAWLYPPGQQFDAAVVADIDLGVSRIEELQRAIDAGGRNGVAPRVQLKLDTSLYRNGATVEEWPGLVDAAVSAERDGRIRLVGAFTHIAEASEEADTDALRAFERGVALAEAAGGHFEVRHLAASSAGFRRADVRLDLVRMGGHCWGIPSFDGITPAEMGLIPVMTLTSSVLSVEVDTDGRLVAEIASGYLHGIPSAARGRVEITINGARYPLDVAVNAHTSRASVDDRVSVGDRIVLFGSGAEGEQTVREWGDLTGTLGDEITCQVDASVTRLYRNRTLG